MPSKHGALYPRTVGMPQKFRKPLVFGTFFILFKIVLILICPNPPDPNPDPKAEMCGKVRKLLNLQTTPRPETIPLHLPPPLPFSLFSAPSLGSLQRKSSPLRYCGVSFFVKQNFSTSVVHLRWNTRSPTSCLSQS